MIFIFTNNLRTFNGLYLFGVLLTNNIDSFYMKNVSIVRKFINILLNHLNCFTHYTTINEIFHVENLFLSVQLKTKKNFSQNGENCFITSRLK